MNGKSFTVREASEDDVVTLSSHRSKLWEEVHDISERGRIQATLPLFVEWVRNEMRSGTLVAFIAESGGAAVSSACIWFRPTEPKLSIRRWEEAYLMTMYTEREYRRMGAASAVLGRAIDCCRERGLERIALHSSEQGVELYRLFGFEATTEMRLRIGPLPGKEGFKP